MKNLVSKSEADAFLAELEKDLRGVVQAEVAALRKSADGELRKDDKGPAAEESSPEQPAADVDAAAEGAEEPAGDAPEAGGEEAPAPDADAAPAEDAAPMADEGAPAAPEMGAEGAAPEGMEGAAPEGAEGAVDPAAEQGPMSPEELQAEYAKLTPDELRMHYLAAKQALFALMGGAEGAAPAAPEMGAEGAAPAAGPGPEAAAPAPAPEAAMAPPAPAPAAAPEEEEAPAMKNESTAADLVKAEVDGLKAQVAEMEAVILKLARQPVRKAVVATDVLVKDEAPMPQLSKAEVFAKLTPRLAEMSKSDRKLVNDFTFGNVGIKDIAHLLK